MRRTAGPSIAVLVAAGLLLVLAAAPASAIRSRRVLGGLDQPVAFTFDPSGRIWYVEKTTGEIHVADPSAGSDDLFATVPGVNGEGERGMLGIALHPNYPDRPYVYVYATRTANGRLRNQVLRYEDVGGAGEHRRTIMSVLASSSPYHNGGRILFGPDGKLYVIVGDAHSSANAQDRHELRGKILRFDPDGTVPRSNPFRSPVWAYGIRNSFGFTFDPETGRLWETENGPECNDEINLIRRGGNYGWGPSETCSGSAPRNTNRDGRHPIMPKVLYENTIAVTGIAFCDGCHLGGRNEGAAFHAAANDGRIERLLLDERRTDVRRHTTVLHHDDATLSMEDAPDGRIYFSDFSGIYVLTR